MRFTSAIASSALALGALLGGPAVSADTDAQQTVGHRAAASELLTDPVASTSESDHGNG
ncbi:hypothetical protein LG634_25645 [Streptomyces bambusae]|uniref:hypothetical protein n=1 Tax=Streptomyces bambusae TaxID=1550616 RepID=UPI001CFF2033|nr:hypothetical protein [Streptomyces bambusae]MCB5168202.1 hypothetical protein [Streptomyces bambusae]